MEHVHVNFYQAKYRGWWIIIIIYILVTPKFIQIECFKAKILCEYSSAKKLL